MSSNSPERESERVSLRAGISRRKRTVKTITNHKPYSSRRGDNSIIIDSKTRAKVISESDALNLDAYMQNEITKKRSPVGEQGSKLEFSQISKFKMDNQTYNLKEDMQIDSIIKENAQHLDDAPQLQTSMNELHNKPVRKRVRTLIRGGLENAVQGNMIRLPRRVNTRMRINGEAVHKEPPL